MPINVVDYIAKGFLLFTSEYALIVLLTIGFLGFNRDIFGKALFILLLSMVLNTSLKALWQVPLAPHLGEGWAFPSGHMQNPFVLWGCLALEFKRPGFLYFVIFLLVGIAFSLIQLGFHSAVDVTGAVFFGSILLIAYGYFLKIPWINTHLPAIGLIFAIIPIPAIYALPKTVTPVFIAEGALLGFSIGWLYQNHPTTTLSPLQKIQLISFAFLGIAVIQLGFYTTRLQLPYSISVLCHYCLIGFWISFCAPQLYLKRKIFHL